MTPYTLRRSVARILRAKGVPIEQLSFLLGHSLRGHETTEDICRRRPSAWLVEYRSGHFRLNCVKRDDVQFDVLGRRELVDYEGEVWCLTVSHGNFMVRRNGMAHFTGNCWTGDNDPTEWILRDSGAVFEPYDVRLALQFPNGREVRIWMRHNFKGQSQWNTQHGLMKQAQMGAGFHIYVAGHTHQSGYHNEYDANTGVLWHTIRPASYKVIDDYAAEGNFADQTAYQCPVALIDPDATSPMGLIKFNFDPEDAAEELRWRRNQ